MKNETIVSIAKGDGYLIIQKGNKYAIIDEDNPPKDANSVVWGNKSILTSAIIKGDFEETKPKIYHLPSKLGGNPTILAKNGNKMIIKRGSGYYSILEKGKSISTAKWGRANILTHNLANGGFTALETPEPYNE